MNKLLVSAIAAAGLIIAPANAATIVFKGDNQNATPNAIGSTQLNCGSSGNNDYCSTGPGVSLDYSVLGFDFSVDAFENALGPNRTGAIVIQDVDPLDSGLGVISSTEITNGSNDQVQSNTGANESLLFDFTASGPNPVIISNIEFNSGADRNCSEPPVNQPEGPCGLFDLYIDGNLFAAGLQALDDVLGGWIGTTFEFVANDQTNPSGFVIAQFDVQEVPIPGALPLLLSGIAGLGFAARRKKAA